MVNNQKSYATVVGQNSLPQRKTQQTFSFTAKQLTKYVANVVIQIAQPQVYYPKRKELCIELYLKENVIDVIALNETFLSKKHIFKIPGYDTIRNDRSTGQSGGVYFLIKNGLGVNKEYRNDNFNIITDNEALAIELEIFNNENFILATIYCPNGNLILSLFKPFINLSDNVMFVRYFNWKLESFSCAKKNTSGPILKNIPKQLNLIYLNHDHEHMHMDRSTGNTDLLNRRLYPQT